ncbi:SBBP repeat-containing protein [Flavobacterium subsaxonicum]|nr:T9SS type A sorting domain-containing protein [Flavobacterium subsaxonicum]
MKKITLLCLAILGIYNSATAQEWNWVFSAQAVESTQVGSYAATSTIISDAGGNVYMNCTSTHPSITFGDQTFTGASWIGRNFLVKFDSAGSITWIQDTDATDMIATASLVSDPSGNLYSTGEFMGTYNHQGFIFNNVEDNLALNSFISKLDNNGIAQWAKHIGVIGNTENEFENINRFVRAYDIAIDPTGNLYVCGQMNGVTGIFGNLSVPIQGESDTFIAKYDNNGNILWVKTVLNNGYQGWRKLVCDSSGNVYMAGSHAGSASISFDGTVLGGNATSLTFLVKYSTDGNLLWVQSHGGGTQDIFCNSLAIDANNNIYTAGYFNYPSLAFGDVVLTSTHAQEGFVVKYNNNGNVLWAKSSGAYDSFNNVKTGSDGAVYLLGNFWSEQVVFGETTLTNEGGTNGYVTKMDTDGNYLFAEQIGGEGHFESHMTVNQATNSLYASGRYLDARFGEQTYSADTMVDIFLAKLTIPALSTPSFNASKQALYPNPAKDILNITGIDNAPFYISDLMGRTVVQGQMSKNSINVSLLPQGMYLLSINGKSTKFIKE